jgi:pyruvate-formate lyase-activating enzyme
MRVTLNSPDSESYNRYFKPRGYGIEDVMESIHHAKDCGIFVAVNLLAFPGVTDQEGEVEGLISFLRKANIDMIQMRNLNIDPDLYLQAMNPQRGEAVGISKMMDRVRGEFPHLSIGYFNKTKETFPEKGDRLLF